MLAGVIPHQAPEDVQVRCWYELFVLGEWVGCSLSAWWGPEVLQRNLDPDHQSLVRTYVSICGHMGPYKMSLCMAICDI